MVLIDTPGSHTPRTKLGQRMMRTVRESVSGVDAAVLAVEPVPNAGEIELDLIRQCAREKVPFFLAVNKIDTVPADSLLPVIAAYKDAAEFAAIVPISAKKGDGVEELAAMLLDRMPPGPALFPDGEVSDQADFVLIAETIREKLLLCLDEEVPHGAAVTVERLNERKDGLVEIEAVITCEKESHKGIVIGKKGTMLKKIGALARAELEEMYEGKVFLQLFVRVREGWRDNEGQLRNFGFQ
jgi:GTP-binding protein Era